MRVKQESNVKDQGSLLYHWDKAGRQYFDHFDILINHSRSGLQKNFKNLLTSWKSTNWFHENFKYIDLLIYRQILGDVSKSEVKEVNQVMGGWYHFTKMKSQPAGIYGWYYLIAPLWAFGAGYSAFALFVKKYSIVWTFTPFIPLWFLLYWNHIRQPTQELENAYRYIIAKRAATAIHDRSRAQVMGKLNEYPTELESLKSYLLKNNKTLYDLEADVYSRLNQGSL